MAKGSIELEYQCKDDDAWYVVSVELRGNELLVHYIDSGDDFEYDEILSIEEFKSSRSRFRLACRQLQDEHCDQVQEGMQICALCITDDQEIKFFDAIVKQVCKSEHCSIDGEDQCTCTFKVLWQAGPNAFRITSVSCQNVCLLTTGSIEIHPIIREFVKLVQSNEQELSLDLHPMAIESKTDQMNSHLSADTRREENFEDYSLSGHGDTKRSPSSLAMENRDEGYNSKRKSEQLTVEEEQTDGKIIEGNVGKRIFLHYSRGNVKRRTVKHSEMFTSGRNVEDYNQKNSDMPFSECDHNLQSNHVTCKVCQKTSLSSTKLCSRPSQSNIRQSSLPAYNPCKTSSGDTLTAHCQCFFHSSLRRCNELPISAVSALTKDESIYDGAETDYLRVSNGRHCRNCIKPMLSSERGNMMIETDLNESRCCCTGCVCEQCYGDVIAQGREFSALEALVLDNLEKDVNPFDVKEFITSLGCRVTHVHVLPALKLEQFTRGFVWFQDRASLVKALNCFQDESFFIVSSNGRPWILPDIDDGAFGTGSISESFNIKSECRKQCTPSKILIVHKGTEDFEKAKRRKTLFLEFKEQLTLLHKRLVFEEKMFNES